MAASQDRRDQLASETNLQTTSESEPCDDNLSLAELYQAVLCRLQKAIGNAMNRAGKKGDHADTIIIRDANTFLENTRSVLIAWGCDVRIEKNSLKYIEDTIFDIAIRSILDDILSLVGIYEASRDFKDTAARDELWQSVRNLEDFVNPIRMSQAIESESGPLDGMIRKINQLAIPTESTSLSATTKAVDSRENAELPRKPPKTSRDNDEFNEKLRSAIEHGWETFNALLSQNSTATISEKVLEIATKQWQHSSIALEALLMVSNKFAISERMVENIVSEAKGAIVEILLQRKEPVPVTPSILLVASKNFFHGDDVMSALLARHKDIDIGEDIICTAAANGRKGKQIMNLLLLHDPAIKLTTRTLRVALRNASCGSDIVESFTDRFEEVVINREMMILAAWRHSQEVFKFLLARGGEPLINHEVVSRLADNSRFRAQIMELLCDRIENGERMELARCLAASANEESLELLLERNGSSILTEEVVAAILRNRHLNKEIFWSVLTKISASAITEYIMYHIALKGDQAMVRFLLARRSSPVIFWAAVKGAVENQNTEHRGEILEILMPRLNMETISDEIVTEIASWANPQIIQVLVDRKSWPGLTLAIIQSVAENTSYREGILNVLLLRLRTETISDEIAYEIASWASPLSVEVLLTFNNSPDRIQAIIQGAVKNTSNREGILENLLPRLDVETISDEIPSWASLKSIEALLGLQDWPSMIRVITRGAARNTLHRKEIFKLLLRQLDSDPTSAILEDSTMFDVAYDIGSWANLEVVEALLTLKSSPDIIEAVSRGTARNFKHGNAILESLVPRLSE